MKITGRRTTLQLSEDEREALREELDDIGFGSDDMSNKEQPDDKWPHLSELFELLAP